METIREKKVALLRKEILSLQGLDRPLAEGAPLIPLGGMLDHMPGGIFPTGAVHEFLSADPEALAAAHGFTGGMLHLLMQSGKPCLWVGACRTLFPPGMRRFGLDPDRFLFVEGIGEKEALWTLEEALKCKALCAVIGEVRELDFIQSRRLQLAVEESRVTAFIHRLSGRPPQPTASVARWQIRPACSQPAAGLPGLGLPRWQVELLKIRNGRPGCWELQWEGGAFRFPEQPIEKQWDGLRKTGSA